MKKWYVLLVIIFLAHTSCQKDEGKNQFSDSIYESQVSAISSMVGNEIPPFSPETYKELSRARRASAKYHKIDVALNEGYVDIQFVAPNMGHHFMKFSLLDDHFDPEEPELLVYQKNESTGKYKLVAVEYAYDNGDYENAPDGFSGINDEWHLLTDTGPWLLHAWIWAYNPEGIFNPTNPLVE